MFVIYIDHKGNKSYYSEMEEGYWFRWYENESTHPEFWEIVPWCGY